MQETVCAGMDIETSLEREQALMHPSSART